MKFIKPYYKFKESIQVDTTLIQVDINESLGMFYDIVMKSIDAEEVDFYDTFKINKDEFGEQLNLDLLNSNPSFIKSLSSVGLKKSIVTNSEDFETFLNKPCKFILIHKVDMNELGNPDYIIFQSWNDTLSKWENFRMYKVKGDIKNFYDKLSSKVIEIDDAGDKYIYQTTNGNEWQLQNLDKSNDTYKKYFRKNDFEDLINSRNVKLNII